jgi:peptidoglycan/LPS O-acetylase OafA/YrhL
MQRLIAAILAIPTLFNGLTMLVAGPFWYASVPGASGTGPFNPHFVQDIGVAFLVAGLALAARAWRPRYWPAAIAGAGFLAAHALIHLVAIIGGHDHQAGFDLVAVVLPSAFALYSAFPSPKEYQGEYHA